MTYEEMLAYAKSVAGGCQFKKPDVIKFMQALVASSEAPTPEPEAVAEPNPLITPVAPPCAVCGRDGCEGTHVVEVPPAPIDYGPSPVKVKRYSDNCLWIQRDAVRAFRKREALAFAAEIVRVADSLE